MSLTPPLLGERPAFDQTCGRWLGELHCGKPGVVHVAWTPDIENGIMCDEHWLEAQATWAFFDHHPVVAMCGANHMSTWIYSWAEPPGKCVWMVSDDTFAAVQAAERTLSTSP